MIREEIHDTYREREKPKEPARCPDCGAVFKKGRWVWVDEAPADVHEHTCPACQRMRDDYPAGFVTVGGSFFDAHRNEIVNLVRNEAEKESGEHPLKRIMGVKDTEDGVLVTTTDAHLARRIGDALARAYEGELDYDYNRDDDMLRVTWKREA